GRSVLDHLLRIPNRPTGERARGHKGDQGGRGRGEVNFQLVIALRDESFDLSWLGDVANLLPATVEGLLLRSLGAFHHEVVGWGLPVVHVWDDQLERLLDVDRLDRAASRRKLQVIPELERPDEAVTAGGPALSGVR